MINNKHKIKPMIQLKLSALCLSFVFFALQPERVYAQSPFIPRYQAKQIIVASSQEESPNYFAFPSVLRVAPDKILISFKRGTRHGADQEAGLEMVLFNTKDNKIIQREKLSIDAGIIHQMGEWVRFPNGTIKLYIDAQHSGHDKDNYRTGLREISLKKSGAGFTASASKLSPTVDGREYGYVFDYIVSGNTTYLLVMGFGYRPGGKWSVDVIESKDNGKSWRLVRDLTEELGGHKINESAFIPWEDGYIVTTREYGPNQRIYKLDKDFKLLKEHNLSESNEFIENHLGRPRLFERDGQLYLVGRNWRTTSEAQGRQMELGLFRIDPGTLDVTKWVVADNADRAKISDGHYAVPYFAERDGTVFLNLIDYRGVNGQHPDIVRHEFLWDEVK